MTNFTENISIELDLLVETNRQTLPNCFSQSLFVAKSTITILNNMGVKNDFINDFLEFLLKQKDNISNEDSCPFSLTNTIH